MQNEALPNAAHADDEKELLRPFLITEDYRPSEVRNHACMLGRELVERIRPHIKEEDKVLLVFVMRGAMLLYPPFAKEFDGATYSYAFSDSHTDIDCLEYDTLVIVDTIINSGATIFSVKRMLEASKVRAKNWFVAAAFSHIERKDALYAAFDRVFCLCFIDYISSVVDAGQYAVCGDGMLTQKRHIKKL